MLTLGTRFKQRSAPASDSFSWFLLRLALAFLLLESSPSGCCWAAKSIDNDTSAVWTLSHTLLYPTNALDSGDSSYFTDVAHHPTRPHQLAAATASGQVHFASYWSSNSSWTWQSSFVTVNPHGKAVRRVRYNPAGTLVATASNDGTVLVWSLLAWMPLKTLTMATVSSPAQEDDGAAAAAIPLSLAWHPSGRYLAATGHGMGVEVWDAENNWQSVATLLLDDNRLHHHLDWSPDGQQLVVDGGAVYWWVPPSKMLHPRGLLFSSSSSSNDNSTTTMYWTRPQWSPDGTLVAAVSSSGTMVGISDAFFGSMVAEWSLETSTDVADSITSLQWRPNSEEENEQAPQLVVAGATNDRAFLWSAGRRNDNNFSDWSSSRRTVVELPYSSSARDDNNDAVALAWRPDGQQLAIARGGGIDVWDPLAVMVETASPAAAPFVTTTTTLSPSIVVVQQSTVSPATNGLPSPEPTGSSPAPTSIIDAPPSLAAPTGVPLENIVVGTESEDPLATTVVTSSEDSPAMTVVTSSPTDRAKSISPKTPSDLGNSEQDKASSLSSTFVYYAVPLLILFCCCGYLLFWRNRQQHSMKAGAFPSNNDCQSGSVRVFEEVENQQPVTVESSTWDDRRINHHFEDSNKNIDAECSTCESQDMTETTTVVSSFDGEDPAIQHCNGKHTSDVDGTERTSHDDEKLQHDNNRISSILDDWENDADDEREERNLGAFVARSTDDNDEESSRGWTSNSNSSFFIDGATTDDEEFDLEIV